MDVSLRSARRFGYNGALGVGDRPVPRVTRPAMDTIFRSQTNTASSPAEKPIVAVLAASLETSAPTRLMSVNKEIAPVAQPLMEVPVSPLRPAIHPSSHSNASMPVEVPPTVALEEAFESLVLSDEMENTGKPAQRPRGKRRLGIAMSALLVIGAAGVFLRQAGAVQPAAQVLSAHKEVAVVAMSSAPVITNDIPPANYLSTYQVGKMQARIITIGAISVEARAVPVGVDGRGQPQLPTHAYDIGWYNVSAKPGEAGAVVVSGTCSTEAGKGVFEKLSSLNKGDSIAIERGDGIRVNYSVKEIYRSPVDSLDMTKVLSPFDPKAPGLSLVTCDGTYDRATNDSADRLVVRAVQI